ncbi:unnamed protein product [Dovyalis caffra]|uniref:POX domain-containing protein n=1 Tax=Dovyalis caffra TaxID=77055 RepID=A0AAV1RE97_9ROSI|nr:unnamed protein product [Dovyalis caffra]
MGASKARVASLDWMETKGFGLETHVAQQSRRDKLRFQQSLTLVQHLDDFSNNLDQLAVAPGLTPDLVQVRHVGNGNILYDPTLLSSAMLNFATSSNVLSAQRDAMVDQEIGQAHLNRPIAVEDSSFSSMSHPVLSNLNASPTASNGDAQGCSNWTKLGSEHSYDLTVDYTGGSVVAERNQKLMSAGDVLSNNARVTTISTYPQYLKPGYNEYRDIELQSSVVNPSDEFSSQDSQKQFREVQFTTHPLYQNTLQDVVTSGLIGRTKECILHPSCEDQSTALHFNNVNAWLRRPTENSHQWSGELGLITRKSSQELGIVPNDDNTQGLSLSLSSNRSSEVNETQFGEAYESECLQSKNGFPQEPHHDSKVSKASYLCPLPRSSNLSLCPLPRPSNQSKGCGKSLQDLPGNATNILRNTGPLGPFTGYATILNSSRFFKPAQELLDEFCGEKGLKLIRTCELPKRIREEASPPALSEAVNAADTGDEANDGNNLGASSLTFRRSNEEIGDCGVGNSSSGSYRPEYQQMKAKLLYLQEEVCRRYKQYHQQMQMVASSFESVAGLSAATPYISLALKAVSGNFRSLKHAISDQLKHVTKAIGENLFSPNTFGSSTAGSFRYKDYQSFQKNKSGGPNVGYLEPQEHIWRPQRGLPERAVVSNWFINARVRLWKPMVEEIHTLETKGLLENNQSSGKNGGNSTEPPCQPDGDHQDSKKPGTNYLLSKQLEFSGIGSSGGSGDQLDAEQWNQEKRLRMEFQVPMSADRSLMNFMPYQKTGSENGGGLGAVSLTLGLRHGVENAQHQQLQQNENRLRRPFGGFDEVGAKKGHEELLVKTCMPVCMKEEGATVTVCQKSCEDASKIILRNPSFLGALIGSSEPGLNPLL